MNRSTVVFGLSLVLLSVGSCLFQNDPMRPNVPPEISSSLPKETYLYMQVPDSVVFSISAVDADRDKLDYSFVAGDSLLAVGDRVVFRAMDEGVYLVEGRAFDGKQTAVRSWTVRVFAHANEPPVITAKSPVDYAITRTVGDTLEFVFSAQDDDPSSLMYSWDILTVEGASVDRVTGSNRLIYRLLETGLYRVRGAVWDGQYGDTTSWFLTMTGFPDSILPSPILDLEGETGTGPGTVRLRWTAPGEDGAAGTCTRYEVKTSTRPILTEEDWDKANRKNGAPKPSPPGYLEEMTVYDLLPGTDVYVMVRGVDDFSNMSPLGNHTLILVRGYDVYGRITDLLTGDPVPGIELFSGDVADTSDATGGYMLRNLPYYTGRIRVRDETVIGEYGDWYDLELAVRDLNESVEWDIGLLPNIGLHDTVDPYHYDGDFLLFFQQVTDTDGKFGLPTVYRGWNHWPLTVYNPPKTVLDNEEQPVSLADEARGAMADWETMSGLDLFVETGDSASADIVIIYDDELEYKHHYETVALNPDGTPKQRSISIFTRYTGVPIQTLPHLVFAHEFGHCLAFLDHSVNYGHLMIGNTLPQQRTVTLDEARVVQAVYHSPPIIDYGEFLYD